MANVIEVFEQQVNQLLADEKYDDAFQLCSKHIIEFSKKTDGFTQEDRHFIAVVYSVMAQLLEPDEALKCLDSAISFMGNSAALYLQRAEIKEVLSDIDGAIEDCSIIIYNAPDEAVYTKRASLYMKKRNFKEAIDDCSEAIGLNPKYIGAYITRGHAKRSLGNFEDSINDYNKAIDYCPDYAYTYGYRGDAKIQINDYEGALADFRHLLKLEPDNEQAKRAFLDLKIHTAGPEGIQALSFTKKDGSKVTQYLTDE